MLGSNLGTSNFAYILRANMLCDELGVDTISTGSIVGAVIEGLERGFLSAMTWTENPSIGVMKIPS